MDVETWKTYLRFFVRRWLSFLILAAVLCAPAATQRLAFAINEKEPLHYNGDKYIWDRKNSIVTMIGHATVNQPGETIIADYIRLDLVERSVLARGNVKYYTSDIVIESEEMQFDLTTKTGSIIKGRMSSEGFTLTGDRINKLAGTRYQTLNGTYTTCKDCPQSWIMEGESVDLAFGGYAVIKNMRFRVLDTPVLWSPLMIFPMKTQRQSGVLFPRQGIWNNNFFFEIPVYWAISDWADMTFTGGYYFGDYGPRLAWEGRYQLTPRSGGIANFFYLMDRTANSPAMNRWALSLNARQELPWGLDSRIRIVEMNEHLFPNWMGGVPGAAEPTADSEVSVWGASEYVSGYVLARRSRNLLNFENPTQFDPKTVQLLPRAELSTRDRRLFGLPLTAGVSFGLSNFVRGADYFDLAPDLQAWNAQRQAGIANAPLVAPAPGSRDFIPGQDPIRTGTRLLANPSVYATFQPWGVFSVIPGLEYRFFYYDFPSQISDLTRGYFQFRTDFTTQIERVYETGSKEFPRLKHLIRPKISYFLIPYEHRSDDRHPFIQQIQYAQENGGVTGYNFDSYDIVPINPPQNYNNFFFPVGNAIQYGVTTQLIRRRGAMEEEGVYERLLEVFAQHSINFIQLGTQFDAQPFSPIITGASFSMGRFGSGLGVSYFPYTPPGNVPWVINFSTNFSFEPPLGQRLFAFERSVSLTWNYSRQPRQAPTSMVTLASTFSISDFIMPRASIAYDFATSIMQNVAASVRFQSPSECWYIELGTRFDRGPVDGNYINSNTFEFKMNFSGSGFSGVGEFADRLQTQATTGSGL
jgi:lipopolysaccharide assembly outer membrane protein LptD (OstA)